jgi:isopenicillin-N N-acyltransferase-like protein
MGRALGEAAREEVRGFAAVALERVNLTTKVSRETALGVARNSLEMATRYAPDLVEEIGGIAAGAGLSIDDIMLLQVRNQLQPDTDAACTGFSLTAPTGGPFVGQNWDNDPALDPYTVVLRRHPAGKPAVMEVTQAGLIGYIGLNDRGMGVCLNTLVAPARLLGVPHYFTVRRIHESGHLEAAVAAVTGAERAIPANILLATPDGPADLEVTPERVYVLRADRGGVLVHANHALHPDLVPICADLPELIQSRTRQARLAALLAAVPQPLTPAALQLALADHQGWPRSICRHANDSPTTGHWASVLSVVMEPNRGVMHVTRGQPCRNPYETYHLN